MQIFIDLLNSMSKFAWPALIGIVLYMLWPEIRGIIKERNFKVKVGDAEITVQEASNQLSKQVEDLQDQVASLLESGAYSPVSAIVMEEQTAKIPSQSSPGESEQPSQPLSSMKNKTILWVDDNPSNNAYERAKFMNDGFQVEQTISTSMALEWIDRNGEPYSIISDMGRKENGKYIGNAGEQLLKEARSSGVKSPFYIYSTKKQAQAYRESIIQAGGNGITASPLDLFMLVSQEGLELE